jgi:amidophosphoribosyltransferase
MCGIAGMYNIDGSDISSKLRLSIFAINSRGQEACGMSIWNGKYVNHYKDFGLVMQVFTNEIISKMFGYSGIAQVRYSTTGLNNFSNIQPMRTIIRQNSDQNKEIHLVHNGNIPNIDGLKNNLIEKGADFTSSSDTEIILKWLAFNYTGKMTDTILNMMDVLDGSYSLIILFDDCLYGVRDPMGNRPLVYGKAGKNTYAFASETYSFDVIGGEVIREVKPGEIVRLTKEGVNFIQRKQSEIKNCSFEWIYLQDATSTFENINVAKMRYKSGYLLGEKIKEKNIEADCVIGIPETGVDSAQGLADFLKLPLEQGLKKNRYAIRTFIEPDEAIRRYLIRMKLKPVEYYIKNKRIILVDDSIVRGNTSIELVRMIKEYSPKEIHFAVASPPVCFPCDWGVSLKTKREFFTRRLDSSMKTIEEMKNQLKVDSLTYLTIEDLEKAVGIPKEQMCLHCFDGNRIGINLNA